MSEMLPARDVPVHGEYDSRNGEVMHTAFPTNKRFLDQQARLVVIRSLTVGIFGSNGWNPQRGKLP